MYWQWELDFLNRLGAIGNQNPALNWLSYILLIFTFSCEKGLIWIIAAIVMLFFKKWRKTGIMLGVALLLFALLFNNVIIKYSFHRFRPFDVEHLSAFGLQGMEQLSENAHMWLPKEGSGFLGFFEMPGIGKHYSYSFMSGHTFSSFLCATIIVFNHKKTGIAAFVVAALIAFSRLYFGVHYPTDVIFGMLIGFLFGLLTVFLQRKFYARVEEWVINLFRKRNRKVEE